MLDPKPTPIKVAWDTSSWVVSETPSSAATPLSTLPTTLSPTSTLTKSGSTGNGQFTNNLKNNSGAISNGKNAVLGKPASTVMNFWRVCFPRFFGIGTGAEGKERKRGGHKGGKERGGH